MGLKEESFEIDYNGKMEEVTVQEMPFDVRSIVQQKYIKQIEYGGTIVFVTDPVKMHLFKAEMLSKGVTKAPFEIKPEVILKLPGTIVDRMYLELERINTINEGKKNQAPDADEGRKEGAEE